MSRRTAHALPPAHRRRFPPPRYALSPHATVIYFWTFYIVVLFILLNMFISIIMQAAEEVSAASRAVSHSPATSARLNHFRPQVKDGISLLNASSVAGSSPEQPASDSALEPYVAHPSRPIIPCTAARRQRASELHVT